MTNEIMNQRTSSAEADGDSLSDRAFRNLLDAFMNARIFHEDDEQHAAAERKLREVRAMIERHTPDARWRELLREACKTARNGAHEHLLLCFPSAQCTDGGRAINAPYSTWPTTLTGEAADVYRVWHDQLHPRGFRFTARVLDYPDRHLGDVGLFLSWTGEP
jgi:hypothetical protein